MNREEYFFEIEQGLYGLPREDIVRWLEYYRESLEDRIEDGIEESQAMAQMGTPNEVVQEILAQTPLLRMLRSRAKQRKQMPAWGILLVVLGAPLWLSLLLAAGAVFLSVFAVMWTLVLTFYAVDAAFAAGAVGFVAGGFLLCLGGSFAPGLLCIAAGLLCAGLAILCFLPQKSVTRAAARSCSYFLIFVKSFFVGKGEK